VKRTFSIRERLIASQIWMPIWLLGSLAFAFMSLLSTVDFSIAALRSPTFILILLIAIPATGSLAFVIAPFAAYFLFHDIVDRQVRRNGGPFSKGDRVVIIPGRHSGRSATITSLGQCQSLKITFDGDNVEVGGYSHYQLKRIGEQNP
jgi:hypothetical protein